MGEIIGLILGIAILIAILFVLEKIGELLLPIVGVLFKIFLGILAVGFVLSLLGKC